MFCLLYSTTNKEQCKENLCNQFMKITQSFHCNNDSQQKESVMCYPYLQYVMLEKEIRHKEGQTFIEICWNGLDCSGGMLGFQAVMKAGFWIILLGQIFMTSVLYRTTVLYDE